MKTLDTLNMVNTIGELRKQNIITRQAARTIRGQILNATTRAEQTDQFTNFLKNLAQRR